jgi:hypothetical protein
VEFLDQQRVITPGQYRLRPGHSTTVAILDMVERARNSGNATLDVFIDLKAFDTLDHINLLEKLERKKEGII